ncbi:MAG: DegV family protein [Eubacteriales bacterium]|nr:DegV family protein [Eubacteriales bacterium]MDD4079464.1 DegV family protein [Eubacteriales bacterium]MDD4769629.1 DegV family protein [Eubacteriales bacterium]
MKVIAIAVDSGLDIPRALLDQYRIVEIPVHVHWQGRQYRDKVDLDVEEMFAQGRESKDFPTTSQPSPGEFAAVYRQIANKAEAILSWHTASALSGTYASAQAGAKMADKDIEVFDTRSVSMGGGLQAIAAAEILAKGGNIQEAKAAACKVRERVSIRVVLDTLDYVLRGGRISRLEAKVGALLSIKPMLAIQDGVISHAGRTRSRRRSLEQLFKAVTDACASFDGKGFVVALGHACALEEMKEFMSQLLAKLPRTLVIPYRVGVGIGAHGGPGVLGACYYNS